VLFYERIEAQGRTGFLASISSAFRSTLRLGYTYRRRSRSNRVRRGPSTATRRKNGRLRKGSTSSYVRKSVVTVFTSQLCVTWSRSSAGDEKVVSSTDGEIDVGV
jgi:hypothetical protein